MSDILFKTIEEVPNYSTFMTLDELNESTMKLANEFPDTVKIFRAGESREGRPIYGIKIGSGNKFALLFGCPHPNEPVGTLVLDYLSWKLAENEELRKELDYTWIIVKVADPDGLKLNEGWLKGPFTPLNYAMNYYRPAGNKQVEWTFPIKYKTLNFNDPIPETKALMNIIENYRPDFIYSLHNAGFGGVYYYLSEHAPLLYPLFYYFVERENIPLSLGEPEVPWARPLAKAIYHMVSTPEYYDYLEKHADKDPAEIIKSGTDSYDYARRFNPNVLELVTEVPYYYDPRIEDTSSTDILRRKAVLDNIAENRRYYQKLSKLYEKVKGSLKSYNKFREAIEYFLKVVPESLKAEEKWAKTAKELERPATVAEVFDNYQVSEFYRLLVLGLFYRMLKAEKSNNALTLVIEEIENEMRGRAEKLERELNYEVIPVRKLVKIQLAAGLYSALYVSIRERP
ncbi:MAG: peptidase M14 [Thermoprotei archaeon]|nr:MAG: peptidase M14 [Thermoprotei archaeon]